MPCGLQIYYLVGLTAHLDGLNTCLQEKKTSYQYDISYYKNVPDEIEIMVKTCTIIPVVFLKSSTKCPLYPDQETLKFTLVSKVIVIGSARKKLSPDWIWLREVP
ncbi:hypothetical protein CEXT_686871 [Caerostris extrusa]|uniref:Uncharacterized protein n=1 Tax=Caerostris extrusa TaxID=172846 RepID=A0AAV4T6R5_CAEEX|nr:hypothetical protein CEXT_686871 [Caerostris extrusa]